MPLPLHGSSVSKTSQIHLFLLLKLYQHQQRNKARSLLLVQIPWTGCSVHVHLPAGTFLPDKGVFDALFSSSIWIGSGWEWDICCQTGVTKYPVRSGSSVLVDTCVWPGEEKMVWWGWGEILRGLTHHPKFGGCSAVRTFLRRTAVWRCFFGRKGDGGNTVFLLASESCLGVRNVQGLYVTQPRRAETRSLSRGRGELQWLTVSSPAQSLNPTAFHGPECLPKWFPAKTGNYLT